MDLFSKSIRRIFSPAKPLPSGMYHYQAPAEDPRHLRLHLRLESGGNGILIVNASTILHLNQTAAEYAYHLIQNTSEETIARLIAHRYKIQPHQALQDFRSFKEDLDILVSREDLDPEIFLDMEPTQPGEFTTPLRLDCALTYRLPDGVNATFAPTGRVANELSTEEWKSILELAWKGSIPHIIFTGGESTLRDDLMELIQFAERIGQVTGLLSDGHRFTEPGYFDQLLESGLDHLLYLLQPDNDLSWQILESAMAADLFITTHITLSPATAGGIQNSLERLASINCLSLSMTSSERVMNEALTSAYEKASELGLHLVWDLPVPFSAFNPIAMIQQAEDPASLSRKSWLYVEPDGDVRVTQDSNNVLGNILKDSIESLWEQAVVSTPTN
jgi:organic radical activating enzyme